ncbi:MFS transporter permease [Azospirillum sp. B21]|uniref:MFS transporter permease n=1 Tax=Azospirillum sp. B21 TaxID=2607496 RepID=UPI0011EBD9FA|nr:MFS transporter permease [Azospirillum sp. B21]KAA0581931.1 MFS transporter permease [Azospirillum sp. B21]
MSDSLSQRLDAIHSMLSAGHRNLRIERHTLILWGVTGAALLLLSDHIFTPAQFTDVTQQAVAWLLLLTLSLGGVAVLDWQLTRRVKRHRDEAWSFIHRQVLKVWWLLVALGILMTFATFFFGGGYMVCAAWVVLIGLGLYVHGLFSEELLEWIGVLAILTGIASLVYRLDYGIIRLIAASVFGLGLPLLALMLDRGRTRPSWHRMAQSAAWMLVVLGVPLALRHHGDFGAPADAPALTFDAFRKGEGAVGRHILTLPAGTPVPVEIRVNGNIFRNDPATILPLTLAKPVQLVLENGVPTGDARFDGEPWMRGTAGLWLHVPKLEGDLTPDRGPVIRAPVNANSMADPQR